MSSFCLMGACLWPDQRVCKGMQEKGGNEVKKGQEGGKGWRYKSIHFPQIKLNQGSIVNVMTGLQAQRYDSRILAGTRDIFASKNVQTVGAHPAFYSVDTRVLSQGLSSQGM